MSKAREFFFGDDDWKERNWKRREQYATLLGKTQTTLEMVQEILAGEGWNTEDGRRSALRLIAKAMADYDEVFKEE